MQRAIAHSERLRFHGEPVLDLADLGPGYDNFLSWVGKQKPEILPAHTFERFKQFLTAPISTTELTERIYNSLYRIFYGKNGFKKYEFSDDKYLNDWISRQDQKFYSVDVWNKVKTCIDTFVCFNLPSEQTTEYPEPYKYFVSPEIVKDVYVNRDNVCEYLMFVSGDRLVVYDDNSIVEYSYKEGSLGAELARADHNLGICLAHPIWSDNLESSNYILKRSPLSNNLANLDWLLFMKTNKRYMDTFNSYPITAMYSPDDDGQENQNAGRNNESKVSEYSSTTVPGSVIGVPAPRQGEPDLMSNPVKFLSPPVDGLNYHISEERRLTNYIYNSCAGFESDRKAEAMNEAQIDSTFENAKDVLLGLARNFESLQKWVDSTECTLRYGEYFKGCEISYGTEFYLEDASEIIEEIAQARNNGASDAIVISLTRKSVDTRFKNDPTEKMRAKIINDLDPFPSKSVAEVKQWYDMGACSKLNLQIKANLENFVNRFERENIDIVRFGENIKYGEKIKKILESFKAYLRDDEPEDESNDEMNETDDHSELESEVSDSGEM